MQRLILAALIAIFLASPALADKVIFKDGATAEGKIYKMSEKFLTWVSEGKLQAIPKEKIKKIVVEGEPLTDAELVAVLQKLREDNKKAIAEEEKNSTATKLDPKKGLKKITKANSETKEDALEIEPFPEQPAKDAPAPAPAAKPAPAQQKKE